MTRVLTILLFVGCSFLQVHATSLKPYNELLVESADLERYPERIDRYAPGVEITIGDLHGNALKLLYFLVRNDVIALSKTDYDRFVALYKKQPDDVTPKDIALFKAIVNSVKPNTQHMLHFLGDDLCDRGMNDFYTLSLFEKLDKAGVPFDITLSNHGQFFLAAYESPEQSFNKNPYGDGKRVSTVQSMLNLGKFIDKGLVSKPEVVATVQQHYLKHIVLPAYSVNTTRNEITIYSHAPIDLAILSALADDLDIAYHGENLTVLAHTLQQINAQIHQWIMSNTLTAHYNALNAAHKQSNTPSPIFQVIWNRDYAILKRQAKSSTRQYRVNYVHGHDSMPNVFNLDNLFGKGATKNKGPYAIHLTHT